MPYATSARALLVLLTVFALAGIAVVGTAIVPSVILQIAVRVALLGAGIAVVIAMRPRA